MFLRLGAEAGTAMINATPFGGLLTGVDPRTLPLSGRQPEDVERARRLYDLCRHLDASPLTLALQFPLLNADVTITLTGPVLIEQVDSTLAGLQRPVPTMVWRAWDAWRRSEEWGGRVLDAQSV